MDELEFLYVFITLKAGVSKTENLAINVDMDHIYINCWFSVPSLQVVSFVKTGNMNPPPPGNYYL